MAAIAPLLRASRFMHTPFASILALHGSPAVGIASGKAWKGLGLGRSGIHLGKAVPIKGNPVP